MGSSPTYLDPVVIPYITGSTVLDAGCGIGRWGKLIDSNYWEAGLDESPAVDGFDAYEPNVELCRGYGFYRNVWHHVLPAPLEGEWDTVLASELLEHLPPETAMEALEVLERAARKRIIVTTPNWHYLRSASGEDNPFEAHLGSVTRKTLKQRGYRLRGAGIHWRPSVAGKVLHAVKLAWPLESLPRALPWLGDLIVGVKDV